MLTGTFAISQFSSEFSRELSTQLNSQYGSQLASQLNSQFASQFSSEFSSEYPEIMSFLHARQYIYQASLSTESIIVLAHITWWFCCFEFKIVLVIMYIYTGLGLSNTLSSELTPQKTRLYKRPVPARLFHVTNNLVLIGEFSISSLGDSWQQAAVHYVYIHVHVHTYPSASLLGMPPYPSLQQLTYLHIYVRAAGLPLLLPVSSTRSHRICIPQITSCHHANMGD